MAAVFIVWIDRASYSALGIFSQAAELAFRANSRPNT